MQSLQHKCVSLRSLRLSEMYELPKPVLMSLAVFAESIVATTDTLRILDFKTFSYSKDAGEGAVVLSAIARSPSLPSITHFNCGGNSSWFEGKGKESNAVLLSEAIRGMKRLQDLDLRYI